MKSSWPEPTEVARLRRSLGMTQQGLAEVARVPQPIISRIENGSIQSPSYEVIKRLFEALSAAQGRIEARPGGISDEVQIIRAADLMNKRVVSVQPFASIKDAWEIMSRNGFSQLPVISESGRILGGISESVIASI